MYSRERTFRYMSLLFLLLFQLIFIPVSQAEQVVVTSGKVVYDPFGRAVRVYHPTVDSERVDSFSRAVDPVAPRRTEYDELTMPPELRKAHQQNDRAVMTAYGFPINMTESECVASLFELHEIL